METKNRNRVEGFTLIELLVVISIISLLVSILLPSLSVARDLARQAACRMAKRNIGIAYSMYVEENNGFLPWCIPGGDGPVQRWPIPAVMLSEPYDGFFLLGSYIEYNASICPAGPQDKYTNWGRNDSMTTTFYNAILSGLENGWNYSGHSAQIAGVKDPTQTVLGGDSLAGTALAWPETINVNSYFTWGFGSGGEACMGFEATVNNLYHSGGYVVVFVDGHSDWFKSGSEEKMDDGTWWDLE